MRGFRFLSLAIVVAATLPAEPPKGPKDPFAPRRAKLQKELGSALALVPGENASKSFRQDNDFWYLTGGDWPDAVLALSADGAWLFVGEDRDALDPAAKLDRTPAGFSGVLPADQMAIAAGRYEDDGLWVPTKAEEYYSLPNKPGAPADFEKPFARAKERARFAKELREQMPEAEMEELADRVGKLRLFKDEIELAHIRRAAKVTGDALIAAIASVKPGITEREFQRRVEQGYLDAGAEFLAFPTIVASGKNAVTIHYTANGDALGEHDMVVCDTGAEIEHYASDVTRSFPVSGKFTARQREVYEAVLAAQEAGCAAVKPGVTLLQIDHKSRTVLTKRGFAGKMPHLTCHWVGLAVHDAGDYNAKLEPGMVLTVEPGVYLPAEGIGCRIEDVLLVTKDGAINLTAWIPKSVEEIEKLAGSKAK